MIDWHGGEFLALAREVYGARVAQAGQYLASEMKVNTGIQGPPRSTGGNFPHMDTTDFNKSIVSIPGESGNVVFADVGSSIFYARFLEMGTSRMSPRPWCAKTLKESSERVRQIISGTDSDIRVG